MTVLHHVTSAEAARAILAEGFRDGRGTYMTGQVHEGVWMTDDPIGVETSGAVWGGGGTYLRAELDVPEEALAGFEWIAEGMEQPAVVGVNYREWLVPASWLREHIVRLGIVADDWDGELRSMLERERRPIPSLPADPPDPPDPPGDHAPAPRRN